MKKSVIMLNKFFIDRHKMSKLLNLNYDNVKIYNIKDVSDMPGNDVVEDSFAAFIDLDSFEYAGVTFAKAIQEINPKINIIFTSLNKMFLEECLSLHASDYILKPFTSERMNKALGNLIYPNE